MMNSGKGTTGNTFGAGHRVLAEEVPAGYKRTEAGVIPEDWQVSTIGAEFRAQLGKMLDAAKNAGVPKPYIGNRSVQWGQIDVCDIDTVPMTSADLQRFRLRRGDLLVCEGGEIGRAAIWDEPIPECYYQKALHRLRPTRSYDRYLMMSLLQLWASTGYLANYVTQTSIAHLPKDKLEIVPLPVPPPPEQRTIAEALSDVDGLLAALEALIAKKRAIKQAAMQHLLTGNTRLPGFSGAWETKRIGEFTGCTAGGTPSTLVSEYWGGNILWMNSGELNDRTVYNVEGRITTRGLQESSTKVLPSRCILVGLAGQGKTRGTVAMNMVELCTNQSIAAIYPNESFVPEYLYHNLDARYEELRGMSSGDGGRGGLNLQIILSITVPFPHIDEQKAVAAVLSDMDAEIAALERRRDKTRAVKQGMMQQLLTGRVRLVISE